MLHKNSAIGDQHTAHNWEYADETARQGATGFVAADLKKLALQLSDHTFWVLTATTPTWVAVNYDSGAERLANKDAVAGYVGLSGLMIKFKNAANSFTNFLTNSTTASRVWTFPDKSGTVAMTSDITGTNSGTNTGDQTSIVGISGTIAEFNAAITDGDMLVAGNITGSGLTQSTNKLLGRGTEGAGAIEEITLGSGLSLTGTTLNASTPAVLGYQSFFLGQL